MISMMLLLHCTMAGRCEQGHMALRTVPALRVSMAVISMAAHPGSKRQP